MAKPKKSNPDSTASYVPMDAQQEQDEPIEEVMSGLQPLTAADSPPPEPVAQRRPDAMRALKKVQKRARATERP